MIGRVLHWARNPEVLGPPDCPLFRRWTIYGADGLIARRGFQGKIVIHHFLPNTEDVDAHDHPWWFWTLILKGGYLDLNPCPTCDGDGVIFERRLNANVKCHRCRGRGLIRGDEMRRGVVRFRPAEHRHVTKVSSAGAWTVCVMGRKVRPWGFWRQGRCWPWQRYEDVFGLQFRCDGKGDRVVVVTNPEGHR